MTDFGEYSYIKSLNNRKSSLNIYINNNNSSLLSTLAGSSTEINLSDGITNELLNNYTANKEIVNYSRNIKIIKNNTENNFSIASFEKDKNTKKNLESKITSNCSLNFLNNKKNDDNENCRNNNESLKIYFYKFDKLISSLISKSCVLNKLNTEKNKKSSLENKHNEEKFKFGNHDYYNNEKDPNLRDKLKQEYNSKLHTYFCAKSIPEFNFVEYMTKFKAFTSDINIFIYTGFLIQKLVNNNFVINDFNKYSLFLTSFVISSKLLDDKIYLNSNYAYIGGISVSKLNKLENDFSNE